MYLDLDRTDLHVSTYKINPFVLFNPLALLDMSNLEIT